MNTKYLIKRLFHTIKNENLKTAINRVFRYLFYSSKIDLDKINFENDGNLDNLFIRFGTDKGSIDSKRFMSLNIKIRINSITIMIGLIEKILKRMSFI